MNKIILYIVLLVVGTGIIFFSMNFFGHENIWVCQNNEWVKRDFPLSGKPATFCGPPPAEIIKNVEGKIASISQADQSVRSITILGENNKKTDFLVYTNYAKILDENENKVSFSYLRKGFVVKAKNVFADSASNTPKEQEINILSAPNILVFSPEPNGEVGFPLALVGEARVFESNFNYRLKDSDGATLLENFAMSQSADMGLYGPFSVEVFFPEPKGSNGTLEVFDYSAKDGSEIDKVIIPVIFKKAETATIKVFFGNRLLDPQSLDCQKVFPIERRIPKTEAMARAATEELLKGPTVDETKKGYFTSVNPGVRIQRLVIEKRTAKIDFDETLERSVGGSCRVAAIRSEITNTLKQFSTVKSVLISINGRTEDILQP